MNESFDEDVDRSHGAAQLLAPGNYVRSVTFTKDFRTFPAGQTIEFHPGLNLLVGDQGAGKSSLLAASQDTQSHGLTYDADSGMGFRFFDFEKQNPRRQSGVMNDGLVGFQVNSLFKSHGETVNVILRFVEQVSQTLLMLDEPYGSLSPRSCHTLAQEMRLACEERGCQIIAAVHNPILMEAAGEVLSVEHCRWMSAAEFLASQREPRALPLP